MGTYPMAPQHAKQEQFKHPVAEKSAYVAINSCLRSDLL